MLEELSGQAEREKPRPGDEALTSRWENGRSTLANASDLSCSVVNCELRADFVGRSTQIHSAR